MISVHQARVFGTYLVQSRPPKNVTELYKAAMLANAGKADETDQKLLHLVVKYPRLLASIDAGLALIKPNSEVRRRLYVMFSILESTPDYHEQFLPRHHSPFFVVVLIGVSIRAVVRAIVGIVIIKAVVR